MTKCIKCKKNEATSKFSQYCDIKRYDKSTDLDCCFECYKKALDKHYQRHGDTRDFTSEWYWLQVSDDTEDTIDITVACSSLVKGIFYDPYKRILVVTLSGNKKYDYMNVPSEVVNDFVFSKSKGKFYNMKIKNVFSSKKHEEEKVKKANNRQKFSIGDRVRILIGDKSGKIDTIKRATSIEEYGKKRMYYETDENEAVSWTVYRSYELEKA